MTYRIDDLDIYRKFVSAAAQLYRIADDGAAKAPSLSDQVQRKALTAVTLLASGLGFWEPERKAAEFADSKREILELLPLVGLMGSLGCISQETKRDAAAELNDLAKILSGLIRGSRRRVTTGPEGEQQPAEASVN